MRYKVITWGPREVGGAALRALLRRPEVEVVGCKVYSETKDGVDVGTLLGGDPIGVVATTDAERLIALDADCVVHTPMLPFDISDTDDEIIRCSNRAGTSCQPCRTRRRSSSATTTSRVSRLRVIAVGCPFTAAAFIPDLSNVSPWA